MKLEKLTQEQLSLIPQVKQEWLERFFDLPRIDKEKSTDFVNWLYQFSNLERPKIIFLSSPLALQYAANFLDSEQVRAQVRDQVWEQVRDQVWDQVWDRVRDQVWDRVGDQVWDRVRDQVGDRVREQVGDRVKDQVREQVGDRVKDQVWDRVKDQVWDRVGEQVGDRVKDQVWDRVGEQVWDEKLKFFSFSGYGNAWDFGWCSFYDFFTRIGILDHKDFKEFSKIKDTGIYDMIQLKDFCLVCENPINIHRDNNNKLDSDEGAAVKWADFYELYYLSGVNFSKELWTKVVSDNPPVKEILALENIEQRYAAIKQIGVHHVLASFDSKLINKSDRGNELWLIKDLVSQPAYFLKYSCPSTGRIYMSGIDPEVAIKGNSDECMAWKFGINTEEYSQLQFEA